ncbi:MAG TPA: hypothetical protein VIP79_07850, partial [Gemmatimonadaceae bacterium]
RTIHDLAGRTVTWRVRHTSSLTLWLITTAVLAGCGGLEPVAPYSPTTDPAALFMALTLDHRAINLAAVAPYDELQLTATPRDARGEPMSGLPAPTFRSSDTTRVWVTPDGMLQARKSGKNIRVFAELVADGNVRHVDTAIVNVTASTTPPMLDRLQIQPAGGEAVWYMQTFSNASGRGQILFSLSGRSFQSGLTVSALDSTGASITGLALEYESLDPEIAEVSRRGSVATRQPGEVRAVARTSAYGVTKADTMVFTVTVPVINGVLVEPGPSNGPPRVGATTVRIRPGGYVFWTNQTADSVSVSFDDPASAAQIADICSGIGGAYPVHCGSGNIPPFMSTTNNFFEDTRGRQFMEPGSYAFRIEPLGVTGLVIVSETLQ